jgi:hypothetical protein
LKIFFNAFLVVFQVLQILMAGGEAVTLRATALETTSIKTGGRRRDPQVKNLIEFLKHFLFCIKNFSLLL